MLERIKKTFSRKNKMNPERIVDLSLDERDSLFKGSEKEFSQTLNGIRLREMAEKRVILGEGEVTYIKAWREWASRAKSK